MDTGKPRYRPAQILSEAEADAAIASGDPERMHYALIDGSRCLDDEWSMRHAPGLTAHPDRTVRWAALFALDQAIPAWAPTLREDFDLLFLLETIATGDPDPDVRAMVFTVFRDLISMLVRDSAGS